MPTAGWYEWAVGCGPGSLDLYLWELSRLHRPERRAAQNVVSRNLARRRDGSPGPSIFDEATTPATRCKVAWSTLAAAHQGAEIGDTEQLEAWGVLSNHARRNGRGVRAADFVRRALAYLPLAEPLYQGKLYQRLGYLAFHFGDTDCALQFIEAAKDCHARAAGFIDLSVGDEARSRATSHLGRCHVDAAQIYDYLLRHDRALAEAATARGWLDTGEHAHLCASAEVEISAALSLGRVADARRAWTAARKELAALPRIYSEHHRTLAGKIALAERGFVEALEIFSSQFEVARAVRPMTRVLLGFYALTAAVEARQERHFHMLFPKVRALTLEAIRDLPQSEAEPFLLALAELRRFELGEPVQRVIAQLERPEPAQRRRSPAQPLGSR